MQEKGGLFCLDKRDRSPLFHGQLLAGGIPPAAGSAPAAGNVLVR